MPSGKDCPSTYLSIMIQPPLRTPALASRLTGRIGTLTLTMSRCSQCKSSRFSASRLAALHSTRWGCGHGKRGAIEEQ